MPITIPDSLPLTLAMYYHSKGLRRDILVDALTGKLEDEHGFMRLYREITSQVPIEDIPKNIALMDAVCEDWMGLVRSKHIHGVLSERRVLIEMGVHPCLAKALAMDYHVYHAKMRLELLARLEGIVP